MADALNGSSRTILFFQKRSPGEQALVCSVSSTKYKKYMFSKMIKQQG
jgi:hypothetical protein